MDKNKFSHHIEKKSQNESRRLVFWVFFTSIFIALYSSVFLVSRSTVVQATTPPPIISYQGKLLRDGASVTTAQNMGFLLFDASTGGNLLYTATGTLAATTTLSITPTSGIFSVDLGTGSTNALATSTFANNHTLYLEVHVGGATLTPRKRIHAVPYAINSEYLSGLSATTTSGTEYIPRANEFGNFLFTGTSRGSTVGDGLLYLNPTSSIDNYTLFGIAAGGTQLFRVDEDGDAFLAGQLFASSSLTIDNGSLFVGASNNRVGVGSTTPYGILSVSSTAGVPAFVIGSSTATSLIVDANGRLGLNTTNPEAALHIVNGGFLSTASSTVASTLNVQGALRASSTLEAGSLATLYSGLIANASSSLASSLNVSGNLNASSTLFVGGNILPGSNNTLDLGAYGTAFRSLYASTTLFVGSAGSTSTLSGNLLTLGSSNASTTLLQSDSLVIGAGTSTAYNRGVFWVDATAVGNGAVYTSGSLFTAGNIRPQSNNSSAIGAYGSAFTNLFASNTIFVGTGTNSSTLSGNALSVGDNTSSTVIQSTRIIAGLRPPTSTTDITSYNSGVFYIDASLAGNGAVFTSGTLRVNGLTTLSGGFQATASSTVGSSLVVSGSLGASSTLLATGLSTLYGGFLSPVSSSLASSLNVSGNLNASSTLFVGGNILPGSNNTLDLGAYGTAFRSLYASTTLFVGSAAASSTLSGDLLTLASGSASTTILQSDRLIIGAGTSTAYNRGVFWVDGTAAGNGAVSTSGTLRVGGALTFSNLVSCDTIDTNAAGVLSCGSDATGGGTSFGKTLELLNGALAPTTTVGFIALASSSVVGNFNVSGNLTVATTTALGQLHVPGNVPTASTSRATTGAGAFNVYVQSKYAYVINYDASTMQIFDISSSTPFVVGSASTGSNPYHMFVQGRYAYVVNYTAATLQIFDISNPAAPAAVGSVATGSGPTSVYIQGRYAHVVNYLGNTFQIFDISNPNAPFSVGTYTAGTGPVSVYVRGRYAYLVHFGSSSFRIIDVSNPTSPSLVGSVATAAASYHVTVQGNYAYVANYFNDTLQIFDISTVSAPTSVSTFTTGDDPRYLSIQNRRIYVANYGASTLQAIDISNPRAPFSIGTVGTGTNPRGVFVQGRFAYVVNYTSATLELFDLGGGYIQQLEAGGIETGGLVVHKNLYVGNGLDVRGGARIDAGLYVGGALSASSSLFLPGGGFTVSASSSLASTLNVSGNLNASSTLFVGGNILPGSNNTLDIGAFGTAFRDIYASSSIRVGAAGASSTLSANGSLLFSGSLLPGANNSSDLGAYGTALNDIFASGTFYATNINALNDITASGTVRAQNYVAVNSSSPQFGLSVSGTAWITGTTTIEHDLIVKGKLKTPKHVKTVSNGGNARLDGAWGIDIQGHYAYVASITNDALNIFDISDPYNPRLVGSATSATTLDGASWIQVAGRYAYISTDTINRIHVWDVSNPANPTFVTSTSDTSRPREIRIQGNYLYAAELDVDRLSIFDISNPTQPRLVGRVSDATLLDGAASLWVSGNYAYVGAASPASTRYLTAVDISDPTRPVIAGSLAIGQAPYGLVVQGKYAYIPEYDASQVRIVDISDPANMRTEAVVADGGVGGAELTGAYNVTVSGDFAYVSNFATAGNGAISILDISSSTNPLHVGKIHHNEGGVNLNQPGVPIIQGRHLYVPAFTGDALQILDVGGARLANADIGSAKVGTLRVFNPSYFDNSLVVRNGLVVGGNGLSVSGDFSMSAPSSSPYLINATNTLSFSHKALFRASSTNGDNFIFDTISTSSGNNFTIFSIRDNGTKLFSVSSTGDVHVRSRLFASSATVATPGNPGDVAERVDISPDEELGAGDVVILDPVSPVGHDFYRRNRSAYDSRVAGVISTNPTVTVGSGKTNLTAPLALAGRVPVKVSDENGPILRGDLLVSASRLGYAMRYSAGTAPTSTPSAVLGMALESFSPTSTPTTTEQIMMLVNLNWLNPVDAPLAVADAPLINTSTEMGGAGELLQGHVQFNINTENLVVRNAEFHGNIIVRGHTTLSGDSVGQARIKAGEREVRVGFERVYNYQPIITVTPRGSAGEAALLDFKYVVKDESSTGFTIKIDPSQAVDVEFNWHAFGVERGRIYVSDGTREDIRIVVGGEASTPSSPSPSETPVASSPTESASPAPTEVAVEPLPIVEATPSPSSEPAPPPEPPPAPELSQSDTGEGT